MSRQPCAPHIHRLAVCARIRRPCDCSTSHNPSPRPGLPPSIQQGLRRLAGRTAASPLSRPPVTRVLASACDPPPHPRQLPTRCHRHRPHAQPRRAPILNVPLQALRRSVTCRTARPRWMGKARRTTHRRLGPSAGVDVAGEEVGGRSAEGRMGRPSSVRLTQVRQCAYDAHRGSMQNILRLLELLRPKQLFRKIERCWRALPFHLLDGLVPIEPLALLSLCDHGLVYCDDFRLLSKTCYGMQILTSGSLLRYTGELKLITPGVFCICSFGSYLYNRKTDNILPSAHERTSKKHSYPGNAL